MLDTYDLTPKQEAFAVKLVECDNAAEAYRHAYSADNMKSKTISDEAYRLTKNPRVAQRIKDLRSQLNAKAIDGVVIDREYITRRILHNIDNAEKKGRHEVSLKGLEMLAKMYDLNEDKQNDRLISEHHKLAIYENLKQRLIDVSPGS